LVFGAVRSVVSPSHAGRLVHPRLCHSLTSQRPDGWRLSRAIAKHRLEIVCGSSGGPRCGLGCIPLSAERIMSYTELITAATALVALIISAVALRRAGRANEIAQEANELAQAPANLAKLQLEQEQARRNRTSVSLSLVKQQSIGANGRPQTNHRFRLVNDGDTPARDAAFEILTSESPLMEQDYRSKLPATLRPKQAVEVL